MDCRKLAWPGFAIAVLAAVLALPRPVKAGPPLICHPLDIGQARSLPWSSDLLKLSGNETYDLARLVGDTLELLSQSTPVIVRMETIRRATLYAQKDRQITQELLAKLRVRAFDAEAKGRPDPLAWFDLGYLVECYKQANWDFKKQPNAASGLDGYAWVQKAISLRGGDSEMEFAAALITLGQSDSRHQEHVRRAMAGASEDALLAKNLASHFIGEKSETIGVMLRKVASAKN